MSFDLYNDLWDKLGAGAWGDANTPGSLGALQAMLGSNRGLGNTKGIYKRWNPDKEAIDKTLAEAPNIAAVADYATYDPNLPESVIAAQKRGAIMTGEEGVAKQGISEAMRGRMAKRLSKISQKNTNNALSANLGLEKYKAQTEHAQLVPHQSLFQKIVGNPLFTAGLNALGTMVGVPGAGSALGGLSGAGGGGFSGGGWGTAYNGAGGSGIGGGLPAGVPLGQTAGAGVPGWDGSMPNFGWHI